MVGVCLCGGNEGAEDIRLRASRLRDGAGEVLLAMSGRKMTYINGVTQWARKCVCGCVCVREGDSRTTTS